MPQSRSYWLLVAGVLLLVQPGFAQSSSPKSTPDAAATLSAGAAAQQVDIKHNLVLGDALLQNGRYQEAADAYGEALKLKPDDPDILIFRARAYELGRRYELALADLEQLEKAGKKQTPDMLLHRASLLGKLKQHEKAIAELTALLLEKPRLQSALVERGVQYSALNRMQEANADWDKAIAIDPQSQELATIYYQRALAHFQKSEFEAALAQIDLSIKAYPPGGEKNLLRGRIEEAIGDVASAKNDFGDAVTLLAVGTPEKAEADFQYGFACLRDAENRQVFENFDSFRGSSFSKNDRRAATSGVWQALAAKEEGDVIEFARVLARVRDELPDKRWPEPIVEYLFGRIDEAKLLEQAENAEQKAEAECDIGLNLSAEGRADAVKHWQKALQQSAAGDSIFRQLAAARIKKAASKADPP